MSGQSYDQKNQMDFDEYTELLNEALLEIENDKKLKATVAQLSKMTGIHRNTISNRIWPVQNLAKIKEARKHEAQQQQEKEQRSSIDQKALLREQLSQTRKEVVYWFNKYQEMKRFFDHSDKRFHQMRDSRDHYKSLYDSQKKKLLDAEQELERLKDLLN